MNAVEEVALAPETNISAQVSLACSRIAPTWPLDQFIAVNPYWGWREQHAQAVAAQLETLSGSSLTMPRTWYLSQWQAGAFNRDHLQWAVDSCGADLSVAAIVAALEAAPAASEQLGRLSRLPLITDLCDQIESARPQTWRWLVAHQISQHCAAYFDEDQAGWQPDRTGGLYQTWLTQLAQDLGITWHMRRQAIAQEITSLPKDPIKMIEVGLQRLGVAQTCSTEYLTALLLNVNGWAAWCAYQQWQANLSNGEDDHIVQLLAIRLAWEVLLAHDIELTGARMNEWVQSWQAVEDRVSSQSQNRQVEWLAQRAMEHAYQSSLSQRLVETLKSPDASPSLSEARPLAQAIFCIDVRSEVFRRALERCGPNIQTIGFAGFFGLPIAYQPVGSDLVRPQLPGLLAPAYTVSEPDQVDEQTESLAHQRRRKLGWFERWTRFRSFAASSFSFIETCGLAYGGKLLTNSLSKTEAPGRWEDKGLPASAVRAQPKLALIESDPAAAADMAAGVLQSMGLTDQFAPVVLIAGHGSQSANNAHAAGLDCGACGGQTGEVNARVLAGLLNDARVREGLAERGLSVPDDTVFVPAVHNTTTDGVMLFDADGVAKQHPGAFASLREALDQAGHLARDERAASLGLEAEVGQVSILRKQTLARANDWSQVRPEWGLANNAAFIVAPRARTQALDLEGRCFLHDYDWQSDKGFGLLETIMTAPMVVANWINMQYNASTTDNVHYGSGNKVLHNVVGGRIGVFEGNGGDLRIGLPLQSLYDGENLRHTPLRLSVFIEAPRRAIDDIIAKHGLVRDLIANEWITLFQLDEQAGTVARKVFAGGTANLSDDEVGAWR
ncbi:MAG: YbcC family protein [Burkholderiaceae bacterium]